jgi:hypothetical protein
MSKKLKRKVGDKVIINEKFISAMGKEAIIDSIETDKSGREWYRLRHKGGLDPFNWKESDFFDYIEEMNKPEEDE